MLAVAAQSRADLIEGLENTIRVIERMACGYRDDRYFFLKIRRPSPQISVEPKKRPSDFHRRGQALPEYSYLNVMTLVLEPPSAGEDENTLIVVGFEAQVFVSVGSQAPPGLPTTS